MLTFKPRCFLEVWIQSKQRLHLPSNRSR